MLSTFIVSSHQLDGGNRRARRGATAVEFAVAAPILLLFVFALFEFGRFHMLQHTIDNAAYEAARRGIVPGATASACESVANDILASGSISAADITVVPAIIAPDAATITVQVAVDINQNAWIARYFVNRIVQASCTLRREEYHRFTSTD